MWNSASVWMHALRKPLQHMVPNGKSAEERDDHCKKKAETLVKLESCFPQNNLSFFFNRSDFSFCYHLFSFLTCKKKKNKSQIIKSWWVFFCILSDTIFKGKNRWLCKTPLCKLWKYANMFPFDHKTDMLEKRFKGSLKNKTRKHCSCIALNSCA